MTLIPGKTYYRTYRRKADAKAEALFLVSIWIQVNGLMVVTA